MYYDDIYHPINDDQLSVNDSEVSFDSRTSSVRKNQKKAIDDTKKADKGYYCLKKVINHRLTNIELYNSGTCVGNRIRDPFYGNRMPAKIGSKDEYFFFKVRVSGLNAKNPVTLYYDSPGHYERHFKDTLSDTVKQKWAEMHNYNFVENQDDNSQNVIIH